MMTIEHFQTLIEVQGLSNNIFVCEKSIRDQDKRVEDIIKKREEKALELVEREAEFKKKVKLLTEMENKLTVVDKELSKIKENIKFVKTDQQLKILENSLATLITKKEELEEEGLKIIEDQEGLQDEINQLRQFNEGSLTTLEEIRQEVNKNVEAEQKRINELKGRINNLLEICPKGLSEIYYELNMQFKEKGFLAYVENHACSYCRFSISRNLQSQLEVGNILESCPSCGRILVPQTARLA